MRQVYAQDAVVSMALGADEGAPGAAITFALCGAWQHEPPCPLAAHHTKAERNGERVLLRVLFATEASSAAEVRRRIDQTLARGTVRGRDGSETTWQLLDSGASSVRLDEEAHGRRLASPAAGPQAGTSEPTSR